ncbi:hypothetical protein AMK15_27435 [Streptomyces sp. MJM1172]|nr:hypothetical protein AMK15_27435 [Streptomyces sp. MJM1172]
MAAALLIGGCHHGNPGPPGGSALRYWCEYGRRYTGIKARYGLSVTAPEKAALGAILATC